MEAEPPQDIDPALEQRIDEIAHFIADLPAPLPELIIESMNLLNHLGLFFLRHTTLFVTFLCLLMFATGAFLGFLFISIYCEIVHWKWEVDPHRLLPRKNGKMLGLDHLFEY